MKCHSKTLFEDNIAVTEVMGHPADGAGDKEREKAVERKLAWVKTSRNYLISKAPEMEFLLLWAEDFNLRRSLRSTFPAWAVRRDAWIMTPPN